MKLTNAVAIDMVDAYVDNYDVGTPGPATTDGRTGASPASGDAVETGTLLFELAYNNPAFGAGADAAPGGRATAIVTPAIQDTSANATGTVGHCADYDRAGTRLSYGPAATSGSEFNFNNLSIAVGQTVTLTSRTVTMPES